MYAQSLELEYRPDVNDRIVRLDRRMRVARQLQQQRAAGEGESGDAGGDPSPAPAPARTAGGRKPFREPGAGGGGEAAEPPDVDVLLAALPVPQETRSQRLRNEKGLRSFLREYGVSRRIGTLVVRCAACNGHGKRSSGKLDKRGRILKVACDQCYGTGAHLDTHVARKAFWLSKSPYYRANERNRKRFEARLEKWRHNPKAIREFLRQVRVHSVEYHGLWARAAYTEVVRRVRPSSRTFDRRVEAVFIRIGRNWHFFDPKYDRGFLTAAAAR
ncbi:MAG: hypothetical protein ACE5JG_04670 [Planctomycetota bacterium]